MYTPSEQKFIEAFCKELGGVIFPLNLDVAEKTAAGELQKFPHCAKRIGQFWKKNWRS